MSVANEQDICNFVLTQGIYAAKLRSHVGGCPYPPGRATRRSYLWLMLVSRGGHAAAWSTKYHPARANRSRARLQGSAVQAHRCDRQLEMQTQAVHPSERDASEVEAIERYGYKAELPQTLRFFASFAVGFSFISVSAGVFGSFGFGLGFAGGYIVWGWLVVAAGQTLVALVFGALATRMPLAGSSYQWVSRMANPTLGWLQGWSFVTFVVISLLAVNYTLAQTILPAIFGYEATTAAAVVGAGLVCIVQCTILLFSTRIASRVNNAAVITEILGTVVLSVALVVVVIIRGHLHLGNLFTPETGHTGSYVSPGTLNRPGWWQFALLMGIYSQCGFEGSADMSEETSNAARFVPRAMWRSMALSGIVGALFIGALLVSVAHLGPLATASTPIADIIKPVLGGVISRAFLVCVGFSVFACGLIIFMDTTRVVYSMARDDRLPASRYLSRVHSRLETPLHAILVVGALDLVVLLLFGRTATALNKIVGITTVLPPIMYGGPCVVALLRIRRLPKATVWSLGRFEMTVVVLAVVWIVVELTCLRDHSLLTGWEYAGGAFGIGALYLLWRRFARGPLPSLPGMAVTNQDAEVGKAVA
jgi:amino acid transporter